MQHTTANLAQPDSSAFPPRIAFKYTDHGSMRPITFPFVLAASSDDWERLANACILNQSVVVGAPFLNAQELLSADAPADAPSAELRTAPTVGPVVVTIAMADRNVTVCRNGEVYFRATGDEFLPAFIKAKVLTNIAFRNALLRQVAATTPTLPPQALEALQSAALTLVRGESSAAPRAAGTTMDTNEITTLLAEANCGTSLAARADDIARAIGVLSFDGCERLRIVLAGIIELAVDVLGREHAALRSLKCAC